MNNIRIILLCSTRFALPVLKDLVFYQIIAAVAIPRNAVEWKENAEVILIGTGVPIIELDPESYAEQVSEAFVEKKANLGLVVSFPYKIPSNVFNLPEKGFYNIHPGPLPQYRGPDPVFQQLKNQEKLAGVTLHKLDEGMDTGPVVLSEKVKIDPQETYGLLSSRLAEMGAKMTGTLIKLLGLGVNIPSRSQIGAAARYYHRQTATDVVVDWKTMGAAAIIALINACNPWNKGAITKINGVIIRLLEAERVTEHTFSFQEPGLVLAIGVKGITVSALDEDVLLITFIYTEEGFLPARRLEQLGVGPGQCFEAVQ